ncbi:MAG: response regulator transcription factor [Magnetococcales bacterium]|nr:response regulator transcription factor [Magnetococcales bacterium]
MKILVIDHFPVMGMYISSILSDQGYEVTAAYSARDGLEKFRLRRPDLVMLEILLPDVPGCEVAQSIREETSETFLPLIFLTSLKDEFDLATCLDAGGDDYILKPFDRTLFEAKLRAWSRNILLVRALQRRERHGSSEPLMAVLTHEEMRELMQGSK